MKSLAVHWELIAPLHAAKSTFAFETTFDHYAFSETAPDPRLVPGALPTCLRFLRRRISIFSVRSR